MGRSLRAPSCLGRSRCKDACSRARADQGGPGGAPSMGGVAGRTSTQKGPDFARRRSRLSKEDRP
eukprot:9299454-Pyramimonas_sp.AAC.1